MKIDVRDAGTVTIADFDGSLDTNTADEAQQRLNQLIDGGTRKLLVNFANLDFISSAGLRILLTVAKRMMAEQGEMRLTNMNETVREVFKISGFDTIMQVRDSEEEALTELG